MRVQQFYSGGPEVSYNSNAVLNDYPFVDYIICGEGEEPICKFLTEFFNNTCKYDIKGLSYKGNISKEFISDKEPVSPYCDEYFDSLSGRIAYIETTRGCPFNCAFCLSGRCGGVRFFNLEKVFSDIIKLANSGTRTIKFVDRTFNANSERANKILRFILDNCGKTFPENVCFHFEIAGDILHEETLSILNNAPDGLFQLEIGLQTFNEKTLEHINRKTKICKLISNIKKVIAMGNMHIHIDLIAGLPFEDIASFEKTFNRAFFLMADMLQLGFLKMIHGSPMREDIRKFPCEFSATPPYEVKSTPWLSREEMVVLHKCEDALEKLYNSGRFLETLKYLIFEKNIEPFRLFCDFGCYTENIENTSLDKYSETFYKYITEVLGYNKAEVRDKFVIDRMASNSSGKLPGFLKEKRPEYKQIKRKINENFAVLSAGNIVVFQDKKSPIKKNRRFNLIYKDIGEFISAE